MSRCTPSLVAATLFLVSTTATAQTESGPKPGSGAESFQVVIAAGDNAGREMDLVEARQEDTAIFLFVAADKFDRPIARFLRELDQQLVQRDRRDVQIAAIWLTDDVQKSKEYLPRAQQSLQLSQTTWAVFPGDRTGPATWQIDPARGVTIVVTQKGKVTYSVGFDSINETLVDQVFEQLKVAGSARSE